MPATTRKSWKLSSDALAKIFGVNKSAAQSLISTAFGYSEWEALLDEHHTIDVESHDMWARKIHASLDIAFSHDLMDLLVKASPLQSKAKATGSFKLHSPNKHLPYTKNGYLLSLSRLSDSAGEALPEGYQTLSKSKLEELASISLPVTREPYLYFLYGMLKWPIEIASDIDWKGNGYCGSLIESDVRRPVYIFNTIFCPGESLSRFQQRLLDDLADKASRTGVEPILLFSDCVSRSSELYTHSIIGLQYYCEQWQWLFLCHLQPNAQKDVSYFIYEDDSINNTVTPSDELRVHSYRENANVRLDVLYNAVVTQPNIEIHNHLAVKISERNKIDHVGGWYTFSNCSE